MKINFLKSILVLATFALYLLPAFGQSPEKMSYQAVIRNSNDQLVTNQTVGMQISILQGSASGTTVYVETQTPTTNANGLVSIEIGGGAGFDAIDWSAGPYFFKTETDPTGSTSYTITGTSQLLSVPYALHAKTAETVTSGITETDPVFTAWDKSTGISITESQITDLGAYIETETDPAVAANFDFTAAANGDLLQFNGTKWVKVTPTYISDYTVTETDVTAHEAALSVTESQITDLGAYIETETDPAVAANFDFTAAANGDLLQFNGTKWVKVTPTYISDYTVTEGDVTAHEAALSVTESQISDLGIYIETEIDPTVTKYSVGDFAQGGIVFWVDETGQHGLVAAKQDQSTGVRWFAGTNGNTQAKGDGPYAGEANTSIIIAAQVAIGDDGNTYAARICNELQVTEGGKTYGDWYLPSKEELNIMYQNKATIDATAEANGGSSFASAFYWSSAESNLNNAWLQNFINGLQGNFNKGNTLRVRAVRAF